MPHLLRPRPLESSIEDYLINLVKRHGGEVRKVKWIGRRGAPDRLVLFAGIGAFVELKRPGEKPRDNQTWEHLKLRAAGFNVEVASTHEEVEQLVCKLVARINHTLTKG